jgi:hypothetical protein
VENIVDIEGGERPAHRQKSRVFAGFLGGITLLRGVPEAKARKQLYLLRLE